jgi:hypothetical protein
VNVHGQRLLPTKIGAAGAQQGSGYPGETDEGVVASLAYSVSRRTSVGVETGYFRTVSPNGKTQAGSAGFSVSRVFSRRWYGNAVVGYGMGDFVLPSTKATFLRTDFQGRATLGATFAAQSLSLSAVRQIGDSYGLGAQSTSLANLVWTWHPKRQRWGLQSMAGFDQLSGLQAGKIETAMFQAAITRRLTDQFSCAAEGVYTWGLQAGATSLPRRSQNSMRLSIVWHPAGGLW